jgi:hypothetical protein
MEMLACHQQMDLMAVECLALLLLSLLLMGSVVLLLLLQLLPLRLHNTLGMPID